MRLCTSDLHWGAPSVEYSLFFPGIAFQQPPGAVLCRRGHTAHNGVGWSGSVLSEPNIPDEFTLVWEKSTTLFRARCSHVSAYHEAFFDTPVGLISSAKRRKVASFVLFFHSQGTMFPLCWLPLQKLTQTGGKVTGFHAAWQGCKIYARKYTLGQ